MVVAGRAVRTVVVLVALLLCAACSTAHAAEPAKRSWGYVPLSDGAQLRYEVWLPAGEGPFPTMMSYDGYSAGSQPDRANMAFTRKLLDRGYAVVGVSVRGSGCSDGDWELFGPQQGRDGAEAVEFLARQPWSNGRVALFSYSYGGIMQLWVAAERPPSLVALGPGNVVSDTYRDIGFPGGMPNVVFPPAWGAILNGDWRIAATNATQQGDTRCAAVFADHLVGSNRNQLVLDILQHPFDDAWHREHSARNVVERIDLPVLGMQAWQDEETGGRREGFVDQLDPARTWLMAMNGYHIHFTYNEVMHDFALDFYDHFVKGVKNGFERRPHVQVFSETSARDLKPRATITQDRLPVRVQQADVPLGPTGLQGARADRSSYPYPVPSPAIVDASAVTAAPGEQVNTWGVVPDPGLGRATFTTPPLANTVTTYGPSSADLWISTAAKDVDVQVTITEVRPDGREMYVQRGWLRASHRALDPARSTALSPWHPHTAEAQADMPARTPQLLRVDVFPFSHTFRKGSSIRAYVEMPGVTGLWGFANVPTPQTVTVHHDATHQSRLVLGLLPKADVAATLPACDDVQSQPCRRNPVPVPGGSFELRPTLTEAAPVARTTRVEVRFYGRRDRAGRTVRAKLRALAGRLRGVTVELRRDRRVVARSNRFTLGPAQRTLTLRRTGGRRYAEGTYVLVVKSGRQVLLRRTARVGRG